MRELKENEVVIQIWNNSDPSALHLNTLVQEIIDTISQKPSLGKVVEVEGPTFHLPDFFSDLYGQIAGFLIYITEPNPEELKTYMMKHEIDNNGTRHSDIDVYTSYWKKLSRKKII